MSCQKRIRTLVLSLTAATGLLALTACSDGGGDPSGAAGPTSADSAAPADSAGDSAAPADSAAPDDSAGDSTAPADSAAASAPAGGTLAGINESGTLRVCTTGDYRPYTYLDPQTKEWSGIDISMAEALAEHLGVDLELVQTTWGELIPDLKASCDIAMGGISFNDERAAEVDFTIPTVQDGKAPIARCDDVDTYQSVQDINQEGVRVITPLGGTNEQFADENFPDAEVIKWEDNNTIFDQILAGDADVMVTDASETKWVAHEHEGQLCAINPDQPFTHFENGYLLPQGDTEWQTRVDSWLKESQADGTYADAEEPWFG